MLVIEKHLRLRLLILINGSMTLHSLRHLYPLFLKWTIFLAIFLKRFYDWGFIDWTTWIFLFGWISQQFRAVYLFLFIFLNCSNLLTLSSLLCYLPLQLYFSQILFKYFISETFVLVMATNLAWYKFKNSLCKIISSLNIT